jgi:hypothetical protein
MRNGILRCQHTQAGRAGNPFQTLHLGRAVMANRRMTGHLDGFRVSNEARSDFPYARVDAQRTIRQQRGKVLRTFGDQLSLNLLSTPTQEG